MKKSFITKICAAITSVTILSTVFIPFSVFAADNNQLSEQEYHQRVAELMLNYEKNPEATKAALAEMDTVLFSEPSVTHFTVPSTGPQPCGINPTDYTFSVYGYSHITATNLYLSWSVNSNRNEIFSGPLDYASLEFDNNKASYKSSNGDSNMSTVQARDTGIVLFNVEDSKLKKGTFTYGTVNVTGRRGTTLEIGSKYVHTFTRFVISGSASYSFVPSATLNANGDIGLNVSQNMGYQVNVSSTIDKWQIWTDNAITIPN